ncbi:hypothetical protein GW796_09860 [archaeon]|nr:hypothetical protein [archaeon]
MPTKSYILFHSLLNEHHDDFIKKLFNYHSLINNKNEHGESLLHYCSHYGLIEQYYALINIGAEVTKTNAENNLLHYASNSGRDPFLVVELIKSGISPLDKNKFGETSLHCCENELISHYMNIWASRNNISIINLLDEDENTLAHSAKKHGHINSAHYWLDNYPILNIKKNIYNKKWNQCKKSKYTQGFY